MAAVVNSLFIKVMCFYFYRFLHSLRSVEMTEGRLGRNDRGTARSKDGGGSVEGRRLLGRRTEAARSKGPAKKRAKVVIIFQKEK